MPRNVLGIRDTKINMTLSLYRYDRQNLKLYIVKLRQDNPTKTINNKNNSGNINVCPCYEFNHNS